MNQMVKSAVRVFEILEFFNRERRPLRLRDLVDYLDYPTSSIAALLKSMTSQGYLGFDSKSHTYMPTSRLAHLVSWIPVDTFEQGVVLDAMRTLQQSLRETVVLGAENGIYLEYVETLRSNEGIQMLIPQGTRRLLIQTGVGWQLLGRRSEADALEIYRQTVAAGEIEEREFPAADFLRKCEEFSKEDISYVKARDLVKRVAHPGGGMVSILVPVPEGHRALTIGIGGPAERLEGKMQEIFSALRDAVERIGNSTEWTYEQV